MDGLDEYEDKFRRAGIKSPTKAEIESYRPWSNQEPPEERRRFSVTGEHNNGMVPERPATNRAHELAVDNLKASTNDGPLESDRKKLATRIRENMRVRNSFSFDPMATKLVFAGMNIYVEIEDDDAEYAEEVRKLCTKLGAAIQARFIYGKRAEQSLKPDVIVWHRGEFRTLEKADANQIAVVNHNWVFECISKQAKLPFDQFKLTEYQKEEAKTRSELGIGTRRRVLITTRKLVKNPIWSNSEQKVAPPRAQDTQAAGAPVQSHLSFSKFSDSARNLQDSGAVLPPTLASSSRLSNQTLPSSRRTLPSFQKPTDVCETVAADRPLTGVPTQTKLMLSATTTSTKPSTAVTFVQPTTVATTAAANRPLTGNSGPKNRSTADSLAEQMAETLRALCAEPSELRDLVLDDAGLCRDLQLDAHPDPPRKSVKPLRKEEPAAAEGGVRPVQQTLHWDPLPLPGPPRLSHPSRPLPVLPVTKFLRANNPLFMSSGKTDSKWEGRIEDSDSKSESQFASKDFFKPMAAPLSLFYCGAYKTVSQLKGLKLAEWSGLSIIRSSNFYQYELRPEETVWFYDGSESGDLGLLWAIINKVPILSPTGVDKFTKAGQINLKDLAGDQLVKCDEFDQSRPDASKSPLEITLNADVLQKTYLSVFKSEVNLRRKEYKKLVETLEAVIQSFGGKLTKDLHLLDTQTRTPNLLLQMSEDLPTALEDQSVVAVLLEHFDHLFGVHLFQERVEGVGSHAHQHLFGLLPTHLLPL